MATVSPGRDELELAIGGMTCAACASRVERGLNRLDGVEASVNLATERARVRFDPARASAAAIVGAVERAGYTARPSAARDADHGDEGRLGQRLAVAVTLGAPVVAMAMLPALQRAGWQWLSLVLATPVVTWAAWPFHRSALAGVRHRVASMDTLVSLGIVTSFTWSVAALVLLGAGDTDLRMDTGWRLGTSGNAEVYFEVAVVITALILLGRVLERRARHRAGAALRALLELEAADAVLLTPDGQRTVAAEAVRRGDLVVVLAGQRVPVDGTVVEGEAALDRALLTGESTPVRVVPGDAAVGGTIAVDGRIVVRAEHVGAETQLARIGRLVAAAQSGKARSQRLADAVAAVFVPVVIALAAATAIGWLVTGHAAAEAVAAAVAVLIVACPCALGLATPAALLVGTGRGAQLGILVRGPEALETAREIDTVALDKTGTLTTGRMRVAHVAAAPGSDAAPALRLAAAAEAASTHPLAQAVAAAVPGPLPAASDVRSRPGLGVCATVEGRVVVAGAPTLLAAEGVPVPPWLEAALAAQRAAGRSAVAVAVDGVAALAIGVEDALRPEAAEAVRRLRAAGLRTILLTGDAEGPAHAVGAAAGVDEVRAGIAPDGKAAAIAGLQAAGRRVAMVGDGVNDAPALATADLGIAIGSGAHVAIETADVTLVRDDLRVLPDALRLARRTLATIRGNLVWAFAYNVLALPLAALGLLNPMVAAGAMACSSLFVLGNSLRLARFQPAAG